MILNNFLENGFKIIVDPVEIWGLGEMDDQPGLQLDVAVQSWIILGLNSFRLEPRYCNILVFEQALGNKTHGEI